MNENETLPEGDLVIPRPLVLDVDALIPNDHLFRHRSSLHGQAHVARVMVHAFRLLAATGHEEKSTSLWGAVYLHDLARTHDGVCHEHGRWAWERFEREPELQAHLASGGVHRDEWPAIETAVIQHSRSAELPRDHAHWHVTALLKDADALDRVRIDDLDVRYLRFAPARDMESFAWALYRNTAGLPPGPDLFRRVLAEAAKLESAPPALRRKPDRRRRPRAV